MTLDEAWKEGYQEGYKRALDATEDDTAKLAAALEAALHLHQESQGHYQNWQGKNTSGAYCETCLDEWPCDTRSAMAEVIATQREMS